MGWQGTEARAKRDSASAELTRRAEQNRRADVLAEVVTSFLEGHATRETLKLAERRYRDVRLPKEPDANNSQL